MFWLNAGIREHRFGAVTVRQFEAGLDYRKGKFQRVLEPGCHRIWPFSGRSIAIVDMRENSLQIGGQEVLTADRVPVRLNILARYRVVDPEKAVHEVASYTDALHQAAQMAAREAVASRTVEEVLAQRIALGSQLTEATNAQTQEFGVEAVSVAIKDAMLDSKLKAAYEEKLAAEQRGQAALIEARHQVAAARAQANAAKIVAENPTILAQKQLDVLSKAAENGGGNHFVVLPEGLANIVRKATGQNADG